MVDLLLLVPSAGIVWLAVVSSLHLIREHREENRSRSS